MTWVRPTETPLKLAAEQWRPNLFVLRNKTPVPVSNTPSTLTMEQFRNEKTPQFRPVRHTAVD